MSHVFDITLQLPGPVKCAQSDEELCWPELADHTSAIMELSDKTTLWGSEQRKQKLRCSLIVCRSCPLRRLNRVGRENIGTNRHNKPCCKQKKYPKCGYKQDSLHIIFLMAKWPGSSPLALDYARLSRPKPSWEPVRRLWPKNKCF